MFIFDCRASEQRIRKLAQWTNGDNIWENLHITAVPLKEFIVKGLSEPVGFRLPILQPESTIPINNKMMIEIGKAAQKIIKPPEGGLLRSLPEG